MIHCIGVFILIWLSVGLIVGLKDVYLDKMFDEDFLKHLEEVFVKDESTARTFKIIYGSKLNYLAVSMLLGLIMFYLDTVATFKKR